MEKTIKIVEYKEISCNGIYCSKKCEHFNYTIPNGTPTCYLLEDWPVNLKAVGKRHERHDRCLEAEEI